MITSPDIVPKIPEDVSPFLLDRKSLENFAALPHNRRVAEFESFMQKTFSWSADFVSEVRGHFTNIRPCSYALKNFAEKIYMPFEEMEIPVPKGYEDCLVSQYGEWQTPVFYTSHNTDFSADVSFKDYFDQVRPFVRTPAPK